MYLIFSVNFSIMESENYYTVLGLEPGCSEEQIRQAYKSKIRTHHPDKSTPSINGDVHLAHKIIEAYTVLSQKDQREIYDQELKGKDLV
jgi:molecular chaperone DnaJ